MFSTTDTNTPLIPIYCLTQMKSRTQNTLKWSRDRAKENGQHTPDRKRRVFEELPEMPIEEIPEATFYKA